ncbi:MAG: hypothetical protein IPO21_00445 [Bacteroidales bacterium]|nr:hypothetical protein [Bacteroidales bacterium]
MRTIIKILIFNLIFISLYSQTETAGAKILSENEVNEIFTHSLKTDLGIKFPIFRIYNYTDISGEYFIVLTENYYKTENNNPLNDSITGFCIKKNKSDYSIVWQLKDFILNENSAKSSENSIWFWTKYFDLKDIDNDGLIDPIIIYGTSGLNGTDDGRIKILVYYKNNKCGIRHQNGILDFQRNTKIDKDYYNLPIKIQKHVRGVMEKMNENKHAIFPYGYNENMAAKKTYLEEK